MSTTFFSIIASKNVFAHISLGYELEADKNYSMKPIRSYGLSYCPIKPAVKGILILLIGLELQIKLLNSVVSLQLYLTLLKYFQVALSLCQNF